MGKVNGVPEGSASGDWEFHDWYWNFRINRSWAAKQKQQQQQEGEDTAWSPPANPTANGAQTAAGTSNVRSQLAGLRQRAAVRSTKPPSQPFSSCSCIELDDQEQHVWAEEEVVSDTLVAQAMSVTAPEEPVVTPVVPEGPASISHGIEYSHISLGSPRQQYGEKSAPGGGTVLRQQQQQDEVIDARATSGLPPPQPLPDASGSRRKFVAHSGTRDQVYGQLVGLRRKASMVNA